MIEYHQPVLLDESIAGLNIKPDGIYIDATFGGGGHARGILSKLESGRLFGIDQDGDVLNNLPGDKNFTFIRHNFRFLKKFLKYYEISHIDGLLADLGVSSHHFDVAERGFSFRFDSIIDMRMNQESKFSACDLLNTYSESELIRIFNEYGELKNARKIAQLIVVARKNSVIKENKDLTEAISDLIPKFGENQFLAKIYQALRIEVNHEIDYLQEMLVQARELLSPGGRLVIISYHSIEDRIVKNFIRESITIPDNQNILYGGENRVLKSVNKKVIVPDENEIRVNNRARSAKLRIAEKL